MGTVRHGRGKGRPPEGRPSAGHAAAEPRACGPDELDALQLSDSMFPTGMFASSSGLELMFERGMVTTARELSELCRTMIRHQVGTADCVALAGAYDAAARPDAALVERFDAACASMKTVQEAREASARSGVQLCRCVAGFCGGGHLGGYLDSIERGGASGVYPVALGVCCHALGIGREKAALILLHGFAAGMTGAALRLGMIQHFEAQKVIHDLKPAMAEAAASAGMAGGVSDMRQFCPHAEILQMAHQRMDAKMFIT